ncbi:MAG: hypothetical protein JXB05_25420 [Myxococcaceae bacterium]|nr:hypothetical protein [Myxococcaceae bacterium]
MRIPSSAQEWVALIHRFYPPGIALHEPKYDASEQFQRLNTLLGEARKGTNDWELFLRTARREMVDCTLWEIPSFLHEPCRTLRVYLPGAGMGAAEQNSVVLLVSLLAPVHVCYGSSQTTREGKVQREQVYYPPLPEPYRATESRLEALVQSHLGTQPLTGEVLFTQVPDVEVGRLRFGEAKLIDCLFTSRRW